MLLSSLVRPYTILLVSTSCGQRSLLDCIVTLVRLNSFLRHKYFSPTEKLQAAVLHIRTSQFILTALSFHGQKTNVSHPTLTR